jgi:uncharacterized protein YcbK (DUF882 family)
VSLFYDPVEGVLRWSRGENPQLSPNFWAKEFACACGICQSQRVSIALLSKLEELRARISAPIEVTSGFRCSRYQHVLKQRGIQTAKLLSQHEVGNAADIRSVDMALLRTAAQVLFANQAIGDAPSFLHVDTRSDKPRRWVYA